MEILVIELLCEVTTLPLSLKTVHRLMERLRGGGETPAECSCMLETWGSNKTARSFLDCGQNQHIKTLSPAIKWTKLFVAHHGTVILPVPDEWINPLIVTLGRAHKTHYRDGVSDYIRLLVSSLWQILVYMVDLQCLGEHTSSPNTLLVTVFLWACAGEGCAFTGVVNLREGDGIICL